jgi:hypothetical protein
MDRTTKKAIAGAAIVAVTPVLTDLAWSIYKGAKPHGSPVPLVFKLPPASSTSSVAATTIVERK